MMSVRKLLLLAAFGAVLAAACNAPAHADPVAPEVVNYAAYSASAVCSTLDAYPTLPGVDVVLQSIQDDSGFSSRQAAQVLVLAVEYRCPRHLPLLRRYVATYAPTTQGQIA